MRTLGLVLTFVVTSAAAARAEPTRLTLEQLIARTLDSARARMAHHDTDAAKARADEAGAARLPKVSVTGFVAPSPSIDCGDPDCVTTEDFAVGLAGAFGGVSLQVVQPIYTFGKLDAARDAARAGVAAQEALEEAADGDLTVEATRAYWGLKLARELVSMLDDGIAEIQDARTHLQERLADGDDDVTIQDRQRLEVLLAEAKIQLTDARTAEGTALAGVRAIAGAAAGDNLDIDDAPLESVELELDTADTYVERAGITRPEVRAARAGARAAAELVNLEDSNYWPDLAVVGTLGFTRAQGVTNPPNDIYSDPYNTTTAGVAVVLRWNIEPWTTHARVKRARSAERKAEALANLAGTGATLEAQTAWTEASQAKERVAAADEGETAARAWLAAELQSDAIGTADASDLADAYIAWFQMRARQATAIYQWNVGVAKLRRATGVSD